MTHHKHKDHDKDHPPADASAGPDGFVPGGAAGETGGTTTPAAPADPVAALKAERDDLLGRLQRVSADYANYQKRVHRDIEQAREFANESLIKAMLPVLDDMERAMTAAAEHPDDMASLTKGMQLVHDKALSTLETFGLTPIEAQGKPFDPAHHAALMQQPTSEVPPQTVLKEVQKGYQLKGRTVRPAHVIVSKEPEEKSDE